ncbi:MAG TPA: transcriptional regulator [Vicinamibacterales bacterium]|nr:transcriptional regulator [Vicinamibacterales bacterium]
MRNSELVRQWEILRTIDATETGVSVQKLARASRVHPRTIRRDLEALERAGFPLYTDRESGTTLYKFSSKPFKRLAQTGLGLPEMCALYMSRSMLEALASAPFRDELTRAMAKLEATLPEGVRRFLDRLPAVLQAKSEPRKRRDEKRLREIVPRIIDTALDKKRVTMTYHSFSSGRVKEYVIEPYRLTYAQGGIYLIAFVPEYGQMRTFAVERIRAYAETGQRFDGKRTLTDKPFKNSLGVHTGDPARVEIEFDRSIAAYVFERDWHASQRAEERPDGSLLLTLDVCIDPALRSWILSFGPLARVVAPRALAEEILEELEEAREKYAPRMEFDEPATRLYAALGPRLPFARPS